MRILFVISLFLYWESLWGQNEGLCCNPSFEWTETTYDFDFALTKRYTYDSTPIMVNEKIYFEILSSNLVSGGDWQNTNILIRSEGTRIYGLYYGPSSVEYLLIDYNVELGDTFFIRGDEKLLVTSIDTINLINGEFRKRIGLDCYASPTVYWIEGIGPTTGLANYDATCVADASTSLNCFYRHDTLLYINSKSSTCWTNYISPFLDSTYIWTELYITAQGTERSTTRYTFDNDPQVINGLIYYERLYSNEPSGDAWLGTGIFYRSDGNGKVYTSHYNQEVLIYDYSLVVKDTFENRLIIDHIDSISLENGEKRKRLVLRCLYDDPPSNFGYFHWIEGLGGEEGVYDAYNYYNQCGFDADGYYTLCIHRNDTLLYDLHDLDSCWYLAVNTNELQFENINVFPNPVSGMLNIKSSQTVPRVFIYSITGHCVLIEENNAIDISQFPSGIYIVKIMYGSKIHQIERILKL